jgi:hypothetical protein
MDPFATNYDATAKKDDGTCVYPKRIFVTKNTYIANLGLACGSGSVGIQAADCICQQAADSAGLAGTWKAWISDASTDARDRIADVGPWFFVKSTDTAFKDKSIITTEPGKAVNRDQFGDVVSGKTWTGTGIGGVGVGCGANDFCVDWTSQFNGNVGMTGNPAQSNFQWTQDGCDNCDQKHRIFCIEQ